VRRLLTVATGRDPTERETDRAIDVRDTSTQRRGTLPIDVDPQVGAVLPRRVDHVAQARALLHRGLDHRARLRERLDVVTEETNRDGCLQRGPFSNSIKRMRAPAYACSAVRIASSSADELSGWNSRSDA
jgi:hypothetical protein